MSLNKLPPKVSEDGGCLVSHLQIYLPMYQRMVLFVCFVALRPKSTALVMAGRPVHLTTLFPGQA